ncbi:MAG: hypothetical protein JW996_06425 [Candidatus Cloacimonetes bacterium]|nr:hypothetical protein [Candidatus Cloacimonadota bacterium]
MKKIFIVSILLSALLLNAEIAHHGFIRTYIGTLTQQEGKYSVLQNTFDWRLDYSRGAVKLFANPVFGYDAINDELNILLRQAYLDIYFDDFDLRIGKQQIIWGKADGVFITDIISPRDLSEFLLPDFEEIRIGINAFKLDYYLGNSTFEAVWIPVFQPAVQPDENSIWAPQMPDFPLPLNYDNSSLEVENKLSNSEFAFKYSYLGSALDFELMAAYLWDDYPAMHSYMQPDTTLLIKPEHHRLPMTGASFSKSIGGAIMRGEGAYYLGKKFAAEDLTENGIKDKDYLHYLLGYDHNWFGVNVSFQFIQEYILDHEDDLQNDEFSSMMTFMATEDFLRETLRLELFSYLGINNEDALLRPKIVYDLADGFEVQLGANLFFGEKGNFGQYEPNDMLYLKLRYDF